MLCEECNQNPATVVVTITAGGEVRAKHLCHECMAKMENSFTQGDFKNILSSLLSILSTSPKMPQITCSGCGLTYMQFKQSGKLGCARCYHNFSSELRPLLQRIHGSSQHVGSSPPQSYANDITEAEDTSAAETAPTPTSEASNLAARIETLRIRMENAVSTEDFEQAALLRDEIRALSEPKETEGLS